MQMNKDNLMCGFFGELPLRSAYESGAAAVLAAGAGLLDISPTGFGTKIRARKWGLAGAAADGVDAGAFQPPRVVTADHIGTVAMWNNMGRTTYQAYHSSMIHNVSYCIIV